MRRSAPWLALVMLSCARSSPHAPAAGGTVEPFRAEELVVSDAYSTEPTPGLVLGDAADDALRSAGVTACGNAKLVADGRLAALALAMAHESEAGVRPPEAAQVSFHARRLGLVDPTPQLWLASAGDSSALLSPLRAAVHNAIRNEPLTHCGVAAIKVGQGVVVALAVSRRLVTFDAQIPRRLEPGQSLLFAGQLKAGYGKASFAVTRAAGDVERIALSPGRKLKHTLRFDAPGEHTVELLASGPEGVTVVALFQLAVGVEPRLRAPLATKLEVERDADAVARALAGLIAHERKQRGLPALSPHGDLTGVALAHSEDMRIQHFVAHTSPSAGEANERVLKAGLHPVVLLENIGRGYGAAEIHAGLMDSPGHRANILNAEARELGVGVVSEREGDRLAFLATELFARLAEPVRLASAQSDLFAAITQKRKQQKLSITSLDGTLSRAAQRAAETYVGSAQPSDSDKLVLDGATQSIRRLPAGANVLTAALILADELPQVAASEELLHPRLAALGVGVAELPSGGSHQLAVVLLLALRE